jgi:hypothetical protein
MAHLGRILGWRQAPGRGLGRGHPGRPCRRAARRVTAAGRVVVRTGERVRPASRRGWPWVWALASGVVAVAAVRAPGAASDVQAAFAHAGGLRVSWLGVAVAAEVASLAGGATAAAVCRRCIAALADHVRRGDRLHRAGQGDSGQAGRRVRLAGRGVPRRRGQGAGRRPGRAYRSGAPRRDAQPVAEPVSSPLAGAAKLVAGCHVVARDHAIGGSRVAASQVRGPHRIPVIHEAGWVRGGACLRVRQNEGSRAVDSTRAGLVPRGKVLGLCDRRQRCRAWISGRAFDCGSSSSPADRPG